MLGGNIDKILTELSSNRVESAWKAFLNSYSPLIMQVVYQYESDPNKADECFLFVCGKLSDDGFRRLLQFDSGRNARFSSWLKVIVSNLCVDWRRKEFGRHRPYRAIDRLSPLDQLLYHYKTECGMDRRACLNALRITYPDLTEKQLAESNGRLHTALTPRQRWQLTIRKREMGAVNVSGAASDQTKATELVEPGPGPESVAQLLQTRASLEQAMSQLNNQQRLLLRLRFQEDLPLKDVADLAGLGNLHQAKRRIKSALAALAELLKPNLPDK